MFIAILTNKTPLEEVDRHLQAHRDYLARHYACLLYTSDAADEQ